MNFISRAFHGRPRGQAPAGRLPPGQYQVRDFPVLSAGPTPRTALTNWTFSITGEVDKLRNWSWDEIRKLPTETITQDIHCVTKWIVEVSARAVILRTPPSGSWRCPQDDCTSGPQLSSMR